MPSSPFPSTLISEFYRFTVLLTGDIGKAEQVMASTLAKADGELTQIRNETSRRAWFATRIRELCPGVETAGPASPRLWREDGEIPPGNVLEIEASLLAQRFAQLPEPGRSALALFYLESFTNDDIAKLLKLHPDDLADTLGCARLQLQSLLHGDHSPS